MKNKTSPFILLLFVLVSCCAKRIDYSEEFIEQTSGKYLYGPDEAVEVFYDDNELFLKWRGADKIKPVVLGQSSFFIPDMYKKLHFVQHPKTKKRYLSIINKDDESKITYDYLKMEKGFKTPSMHLDDNEYDEALEGYLAIKEQDSTSEIINERAFNSFGYECLRRNELDKAINVFKINTKLHPDSENVYDSLADGYLQSGDSLNAFKNYSKALEINSGNPRAKKYVKVYNESKSKI